MGARVLVVDDDAMFRRSITGVLDALGYHVTSVDSGDGAIALVAREVFDVALIDHRMPGLTGIETWQRIRDGANAPGPVLVTAAADGGALAEDNGMAFLAKPFGMGELRAVVERALAQRSGR
ncbi:MAG: response regulator [Deltaproteobacteria bacterium]|nr:response regulator [Myxococcales bacterium]MDP3216988.1 response regulator [Deltaproteobacteria bacterium]